MLSALSAMNSLRLLLSSQFAPHAVPAICNRRVAGELLETAASCWSPRTAVANRRHGLVVALALQLLAATLHAAPADDARQILQTSGVKGGIVVQLGLGDAALTRALRANDSYQVVALDADAKKVAAAREAIFDAGKYGPVSVQEFSGAQLPFIDNLVNLLVAENLGSVPRAEALRVLVPNGVLLTKSGGQWQKTVKPKDAGLDEWTHYFYDAKGNAASKDSVVAPPERLQWVGGPRWSRHHDRMSSLSAQVTAAGDRKSTRLNSSHVSESRMPSSA